MIGTGDKDTLKQQRGQQAVFPQPWRILRKTHGRHEGYSTHGASADLQFLRRQCRKCPLRFGEIAFSRGTLIQQWKRIVFSWCVEERTVAAGIHLEKYRPEEKGGTGDGSWSPDGRKIVFCSLQSGEDIPSLNYDLRIIDLGSHQVTTLPGSEGTFSPRWSPNGRFIAGLHIGAPGGVKVFDLETHRGFVLLEKGEVDWPTWSSNSQFIYFLRPGEAKGVFRVRVSNGIEERVVDLKGFRHTGAYQAWFGLDPDDAPMLNRDVGTADIYSLTLEER